MESDCVGTCEGSSWRGSRTGLVGRVGRGVILGGTSCRRRAGEDRRGPGERSAQGRARDSLRLWPQVGEGRRGEGRDWGRSSSEWVLSPCGLSLFVHLVRSFEKNLRSANSMPGTVLDVG